MLEKKKLILLAVPTVLVLSGLGFVQRTNSRHTSYLDELDGLKRDAALSRQRLEQSSQTFDGAAILNPRLLQPIFAELEGLEIRAALGNRVIIDEIEVVTGEGMLTLSVRAQLYATAGIYRGPVEMVYHGFAHLGPERALLLDFRVSEVHPLGRFFLPKDLIEAWLVTKIQNKMPFPTVTLPVRLRNRLDLAEQVKRVRDNHLEVTVPPRDLDLAAAEPTVLIDPDAVVLLVRGIEVDGQTSANRIDPPRSTSHDLSLTLPVDVLDALMTAATAPERDVLLRADEIPNVWEQHKEVLGIRIHNRAGLKSVTGFLDIRRCRIEEGSGGQWTMDLEAYAQVEGQLIGKAYGKSLDRPFSAAGKLDQTIPIMLKTTGEGLVVDFPEHPLQLDLDISTTIRGRPVSFTYPLKSSTSDVLRPIFVPNLFSRTITIPELVESKSITRVREMSLVVGWELVVPETADGLLTLEGTLIELGTPNPE